MGKQALVEIQLSQPFQRVMVGNQKAEMILF